LNDNRRMLARWTTLVVWALAAGSALFWGLKLAARPVGLPAQALVASAGTSLGGDLSRLLGADPAPLATAVAAEPAADARFALVGVVTPRSPQAAREGVALIAVDGKPARAFRVGAAVGDGHVLRGVSARGATLGPQDGSANIALSVAAPPAAARGSLPAAGAAPAAEPPRASPRMPVVPRQPRPGVPADPQATAAEGDPAIR
jgi:general secretion pathway protein C